MGNKQGGESKKEIDDLAQQTSMSKEDLQDLLATFKKLADKDGLVKKDALRDAIKKKYGGENTSTLVYSIFNLFDKDGSKSIDFREFVMAIQFLSNPSLDDMVDISFRVIDLNSDGSITKGELREVLLMNAKLKKYIEVFQRNGTLDQVKLSPTEISDSNFEADAIFDAMDIDNNKSITKEEFLAAVRGDENLMKRVTGLMMADETKTLFKK